jgi:hypothetical protein
MPKFENLKHDFKGLMKTVKIKFKNLKDKKAILSIARIKTQNSQGWNLGTKKKCFNRLLNLKKVKMFKDYT